GAISVVCIVDRRHLSSFCVAVPTPVPLPFPTRRSSDLARPGAACLGDGYVSLPQDTDSFGHHPFYQTNRFLLDFCQRGLGADEKRLNPLHHVLKALRVPPAQYLHDGRQPVPAPAPAPVLHPVRKGVHLAFRRTQAPKTFGRDALCPQAMAIVHHCFWHVL